MKSESLLKSLEEKLASEREIQKRIQSILPLKTEVPLGAVMPILERISSPDEIKKLEHFTLNRETFSPEYAQLGGQIVQTEALLASTSAEYASQRAILEEKEQTVQELQLQVAVWQEQKATLIASVEAAREAHAGQFKDFIDTQNLYQTTEKELDRDLAVQEALQGKIDEFTDEVKRLMNEAEEMKLTLEDLERREASLKDAFALASQRYKEAQMQRSSQVQDVRLVGQPIEPDLRIKPKRTYMALTAGILCFFGLCFLVLVADRLGLYPIAAIGNQQ